MDRQNFSKIVAEALGQMLQRKLAEAEINIGIAIEGQDTMSIVTMDEYDADHEFSLRYHSNGIFEVVYRFYDDDHNDTGDWITHSRLLSEEEIKMLPEALRPLMAKVAVSERPMKITGKQLGYPSKF